MHIGWTAIAALWLSAAIPWRHLGTILGTIHLALMGITVVVTGNHYVLDIAGGFLVAVCAILIARVVPHAVPARRGARSTARATGHDTLA
jgi:membrane-associated phospholipid phosphatase